VDELNAHIGFYYHLIKEDRWKDLFQKIQSNLFNLGSNLATEEENREKFLIPQIDKEIIKEMEEAIDELQKNLPPLKNFILPSGSVTSSWSHVCRTVCRRVERKLVLFQNNSRDIVPSAVEFLNRLSDFFFAFGRHMNQKEGGEEVIWKPQTKS
jgi:cob(I)alamin adenosyltransferase